MRLTIRLIAIILTILPNFALAAEESTTKPTLTVIRSSGDLVTKRDKIFAFVLVDSPKDIQKLTYELRRIGDDRLILSGDTDLTQGKLSQTISHLAIEGDFLNPGQYYIKFYAIDGNQSQSTIYAFGLSAD